MHGVTMANIKKHGMSTTLFYKVWQSILQRCNNPKAQAFKDYGARGITVSESWLKFENFMEDMLPTFEDGLTIDRTNNNEGYSKENCRWATCTEQNNNKRPKSCEYILTANGKTMSLLEWSKELDRNYFTMLNRVKRLKWSDEKVINTPIVESKRNTLSNRS
jgi:hypothetical protein